MGDPVPRARLAFGNVACRGGAKEVSYVDQIAGLVSLLTWLIFGAVAVPIVLEQADWQMLVYALLSLTVVRILPVAVALLGTGLPPRTVAFIGWFGPSAFLQNTHKNVSDETPSVGAATRLPADGSR